MSHARGPLRAAGLFGGALCSLAVLGTRPALAQGVDEFGAYGGLEKRGRQSPQMFAFELRLGPYRPNVDSEFGGSATPYRDLFGKKKRFLIGAEFDWQALKIPHFGSLGPGVGWGYTWATGKGILEDGTRSPQKTALRVMPMYLVGVLRIDVLARDTKVPLVGYAKGGLGYGLWWTNTRGKLERFEGKVGQGASYGYNFALGGMLYLNPLDRRSAVDMDAQLGLNRAYWFIEWYKSSLNGFGSGDQMQIGASTWMTGVAFEL